MDLHLLSLLKSNCEYKQLTQYVASLSRQDKNVQLWILTIKHVLSHGQFRVDSKLLAVRVLKDYFALGDRRFVSEVEVEILPFLRKILQDRSNPHTFSKYVTKCYQNEQEIKHFKSQLVSMFQLVEECIVHWSSWLPLAQFPHNRFLKTKMELEAQNLLTGTKDVYFTSRDKSVFLSNLNKGHRQFPPQEQSSISQSSTEVQGIIDRLDDLKGMSKLACKREIVDLTGKLDRATLRMKTNVRHSVQQQFRAKLLRVSKIPKLTPPAMQEICQTESQQQMTIVEDDNKENTNLTGQKQLGINSVLFRKQASKKEGKPNNNVNAIRLPTFSSEALQKFNVQPSRVSVISSWNKSLVSKISPANITNFKLALLGQQRLLYEDRNVSITHNVQDVSDQVETYKIRLTYKLKQPLHSLAIVTLPEPDSNIDISFHQPLRITQSEYKQTIVIRKYSPAQLIFWKLRLNDVVVEFPLPLTVLTTMLKGLLSKDRTNSGFRTNNVHSKALKLNPRIIKDSSDMAKYFSNSIEGKSEDQVSCIISCLLHQHSNTLALLQVILLGMDKVSFRVDLLEAGDEEMGHDIVESLQFLFGAEE